MSYFNVSFAAAGGVEGISYICYFIHTSLPAGHEALVFATVTKVRTSPFFLRDHHQSGISNRFWHGTVGYAAVVTGRQ